jgi:micrococcal nuclease
VDAGRVSVYEYRCKISRVVDGDTVDVDIDLGFGTWMHKQRIRLHGIDTPESRTRDLEEKKYGLIAKEQIKSFMPVGSMQTLVTVKDKAGKYGRILGKFLIYDKKTDAQMTINDWMIREHHAVAYFGQSKEDIAEEHLVNRELLSGLQSGLKKDFLED